jgi:zinc/manganese transport system permease protein
MFSGFMVNAWEVASIVAVVAGVVGFFVVLRGSAFAAHAIPNGSFAGAAGASLVGVGTLLGLGAFSLTAALAIGVLGRRGRHDAVTALVLVMMLALGALFLSLSGEYAPETFSLLFGEVLGVSNNDLAATAGLAVACVAAVAILYRRLLLSSALAEVGEARGVGAFRLELCFLAVVALASTMTVPVVGTLLIFSLMIGPPAGARALTDSPARAMLLSVALALVTVWVAIAASYTTDYPVGFFVGTLSAVSYALGRACAALRSADSSRPRAAPARLGSSHA